MRARGFLSGWLGLALLAALAPATALPESEHPPLDWMQSGRESLAAEIASEFPEAAELLRNERYDRAANQRQFRRVFEASAGAEPARRAALLLAADHFAALGWNQYDWDGQPITKTTGWNPGIEGLTFSPDAREPSVLVYHHDLLWRVWNELPHSPWRELAFLELQRRGWHTRGGCPEEPRKYLAVIERGEGYLRDRPESPHRAVILVQVGQAYETIWTLSQAPEAPRSEMDYFRSAAGVSRSEGDAALGPATAVYREAAALAPDLPVGRSARARLRRLEAGVASDQLAYYCINH